MASSLLKRDHSGVRYRLLPPPPSQTPHGVTIIVFLCPEPVHHLPHQILCFHAQAQRGHGIPMSRPNLGLMQQAPQRRHAGAPLGVRVKHAAQDQGNLPCCARVVYKADRRVYRSLSSTPDSTHTVIEMKENRSWVALTQNK